MRMATREVREQTEEASEALRAVVDNVGRVIVGKTGVVKLCLVALIARGHVLLEDVPGVGKTLLVRSLARSLRCQFKRIQFTPDLLPTDVTGTAVFNQGTGEFEYRPGPIFSQIVLVDEINRTSPKTQAALLEALEEASVSADGVTRPLPDPFFVLATQNPIEYEGTFPLPEAQLDRFLLRLSLGYPTPEEETAVLMRGTTGVAVDGLEAVAGPEDIGEWQSLASGVHIDGSLYEYIVEIANRTRRHPKVYLGVSPRGALSLARASQAQAFFYGRAYVIPDDIKYLAPFVLAHRILLHPEGRIQGLTAEKVLDGILREVPVPVLPQRR